MNFQKYFRNRKKNRKALEAQGLLQPRPESVRDRTIVFESSTGLQITASEAYKRANIKPSKKRKTED